MAITIERAVGILTIIPEVRRSCRVFLINSIISGCFARIPVQPVSMRACWFATLASVFMDHSWGVSTKIHFQMVPQLIFLNSFGWLCLRIFSIVVALQSTTQIVASMWTYKKRWYQLVWVALACRAPPHFPFLPSLCPLFFVLRPWSLSHVVKCNGWYRCLSFLYKDRHHSFLLLISFWVFLLGLQLLLIPLLTLPPSLLLIHLSCPLLSLCILNHLLSPHLILCLRHCWNLVCNLVFLLCQILLFLPETKETSLLQGCRDLDKCQRDINNPDCHFC